MKIVFRFIVFMLLFSCDDGDFNIPSFEFDGIVINSCNDLFLYKINDSETLSIQLSSTLSTTDFFSTARDNESFNLTNAITYRIFDDTVTTSYYCQSNPSATPSISNEWIGSGTVTITNVISNTNEFDADITIQNLVLVNSAGNEIRYVNYEFERFSGTF